MAVNFSGINYFFLYVSQSGYFLKINVIVSFTMICNFFCLLLDVDGPGPSYMEASILIVSPELLPSHTCKSEQSKLETLKEMFPEVNDVDVAEILKSSASLEEATNGILDCSYAEDILNERGILQNFIFSTIFLYWARVIK